MTGKNNRYRILWDIAYALYFISFFVEDVAFTADSTQNMVMKLVRYGSYLIFVFLLFMRKNEAWYRIIICLIGIGLAVVCTLYTRDLYYETLLFIIFSSVVIDPKHFFKLSYWLLLSLTGVVIVGSFVGLIPMVNTPRTIDGASRLAYGFYHSDVLPLVLFYLIVYRIMMDYQHLKLRRVFLWLALDVIVYLLCDSRNGLVGVGILCAGCICFCKFKRKRYRILVLAAKYLVIALSLFAIVGMLLQGRGGALAEFMNSVMTKRLSIAYAQYLSMGLHLFNKMDWSTYAKYRYVLDNGYIFVAMRYGLAFLPFYWVVHFFAARKNKYLPVVLVALTVVLVLYSVWLSVLHLSV